MRRRELFGAAMASTAVAAMLSTKEAQAQEASARAARGMPMPKIESTSRARWMRLSAERHASGRHNRVIGAKYAIPRIGTGMPRKCDELLVRIFWQGPNSGQTKKRVSKCEIVR